MSCNASIRRRIGGIRPIHDESGTITARKIIWTTQHTCTGASAAAFRGNPDLMRASGTYLLSYGEPYNDVFGSGPDGRIRLIDTNSWFEPGKRRRKRVRWISTIELPPPYQWASNEPFGNLSGIDENKTSCRRSSTAVPKYLNVLTCTIYGHPFR